ncbi:MAG TPA: hypothetical protein VGU03_04460 [Frateuria sp.]|uniref:hypothetical protein n=1 Tax=Frateuria sp. TaxID=2211372 RepID=UPI002DECF543|nr:hypothetical protein [Frateuria sp.]
MKTQILVCAFLAVFAAQIAEAHSTEASDIDSAYSRLRANIDQVFASAPLDSTGGQTRSRIAEIYNHQIHKYQTNSTITKVPGTDLELLRRAAMEAYADTNESYILNDYLLDVDELARRGIASRRAYRDEVYAFIQARMFGRAQRVALEHPEAGISPIPEVTLAKGFRDDAPAVLVWDKKGNRFIAKNIDLRNFRLVIVGHPLCHFTQRAVSDISNNNKLKQVTTGALWILPQDGTLDPTVIAQWNATHPAQPMAIAYLESKWPGFSYWGTPTFYFLKNGAVIRSVIGWPSNGNAGALIQSADTH